MTETWVDVRIEDVQRGDEVKVDGFGSNFGKATEFYGTHWHSVLRVEPIRAYVKLNDEVSIRRSSITQARRRVEKVEEKCGLPAPYRGWACSLGKGHLQNHLAVEPVSKCSVQWPEPAQPPKPAPGTWRHKDRHTGVWGECLARQLGNDCQGTDSQVYRPTGWSPDTRKAGERRITGWRECDWPGPVRILALGPHDVLRPVDRRKATQDRRSKV